MEVWCAWQVWQAWLADEWPISSRQDQPLCWWHLLLSPTLPGGHLPGFVGKVYRQIHSIAMGSSVSVVVPNLVMEDVEQEALSTFHTPPQFWRRYMDDSGLVNFFHIHLNSIDPCAYSSWWGRSWNGSSLPWHPPEQRRRWLHHRLCAQISICVFIHTTLHPTNELLWGHCLNSEETTQLRRKVPREKGPKTEPRTHDLHSNAEFQPLELRNRSRSFVRHCPVCTSHGCAESTTT